MKNPLIRIINDEAGSVLVLCLLILMILTIVGISATNTSLYEFTIARNVKHHDAAFYYADGGGPVTAKLIGEAIRNGETYVDFPAVTYPLNKEGAAINNFYDEAAGIIPMDQCWPDAEIAMPQGRLAVDLIDRIADNKIGGGSEFGSAAEGVGYGSVGGVSIIYTINSAGEAGMNSRVFVDFRYEKVLGASGGL